MVSTRLYVSYKAYTMVPIRSSLWFLQGVHYGSYKAKNVVLQDQFHGSSKVNSMVLTRLKVCFHCKQMRAIVVKCKRQPYFSLCPQLTQSTCHFFSEVNWGRHVCCICWQEAWTFLRISTTVLCCRQRAKGKGTDFFFLLLFGSLFSFTNEDKGAWLSSVA